MKITGANLVTNGNFTTGADGLSGWTSEASGLLNWQVADGQGPDGTNAVVAQSQSIQESTTLTNVVKLSTGIYVISYYAYFPSDVSTSATNGNVNYVAWFVNTDGSFTASRTVSGIKSVKAETWTEIADTVMVEVGTEYLVFQANNVPEGTKFANFSVHAAKEVYDTRILDRKIAYMRQLAEDENFNKCDPMYLDDVLDFCEEAEGDIKKGKVETVNAGENWLDQLDQALTDYLDASTENITKNEYFQWVEDLTKMTKYNRKDLKGNTQYGGFMFRQDGAETGAETNWVHGNGAEYISKWILKGNTNGPGSVALYSKKMPAGKYFVAMDVRTGTAGRGSNDWSTVWDITTNAQAFVNNDKAELVAMEDGERYTRIYAVGEVKEGEPLEAGVWWESMEGNNPTPEFFVMNFEIRSFGNVADVVAHKEAWTAFKTQYDAAANNRKKIVAMQADKVNYPWEQATLAEALATWDPFFDAVASWVTADGEDAGVASTDELNNWAKYQGGDIPEDEKATYQVVRGYQSAINEVTAANQPIADLTAAIKEAQSTRDDDMYSTGDKATFQTAINAAQTVLDDIQANTTDAKMEADVARIKTELEKLAAAKEAFIESGTLTPIIDIDFSNDFTKDADDNYIIAGTKGQMFFGTNVNTDKTTHTTAFELGYGDECPGILRMSNNGSGATVTLDAADMPTDNDVLRIQFDYWGGKLNGSTPLIFALLNADGNKVAGIEWNVKDWIFSAVNDFNDEANNGLDFCSYITWLGEQSFTSGAQICVDNNKTSFDLIVDYKGKAMRGSMTNGTNGTCEGGYVPIPDVEDNKITTISFSAKGNNEGRRSWLDNLVVYKYASQAEGPIETGITEVAPATVADGAVYTIGGVKVQSATKPGLYIQNGKKFVVK